MTDLFKQYKVRIWMSAVNPASVVNPAGMMQVQPPSAIGPGAILHSNAGRSHGVGYGFGNNNRGGAHYGKLNRGMMKMILANTAQGRGRQQPAQGQGQGSYDDGYNAFAYQLPNYNTQTHYNSQASYGMPPWAAHNQQQMYMPPGQYPNATGNSPMNYNGFYPPSTYGAPSGNNTFRGGYASNSAAGASQSYTTTAGPSFGQFPASSHNNTNSSTPLGYSNSNANANANGPGNSSSAAPPSGSSYNPAFDAALITSLQNMGFGK